VKLRFRAGNGETFEAGPAPWYRIEGALLLDGVTRKIVAVHRELFWHIGERSYISVECSTSTRVILERGETVSFAEFGPFEHTHCADGMLFGEAEPLAKFSDERQRWSGRDPSHTFAAVLWRDADSYP
jgi:hypothetical protein